MPTFKKGGVVILHDCPGFRQPAYACFMLFCSSATSRLAQSHSPTCPVRPAVRDSFAISLTSGVTRDSISTPVEGVHLSIPTPVAPASRTVIHRRAAARRNLSTGDLVHGRRMDHVLTSFQAGR